jgi:uncharacterized Zn finger protein
MSDEVETVSSKGHALVGYCCYCGVEFSQRVLTNRWYKCESCETVYQCKIKTEIDATVDDEQ